MSTEAVAYELTDAHELATYGGTTHLRDGLHFNIGDALQEGADDDHPRGLIVTDDPLVISALDGRTPTGNPPYGTDLQRLEQVPAGALLTSHQLLTHDQDTDGKGQHQRDKSDVPELAFKDPVVLPEGNAPALPPGFPIPAGAPGLDPAEIAARLNQPVPDVPGGVGSEQPGHPDAAAAAAAAPPPAPVTVTPPPSASPPSPPPSAPSGSAGPSTSRS